MPDSAPLCDAVLQPAWTWMRGWLGAHGAPLWSACVALAAHVALSALFLGLDLLSPRAPWLRRHRLRGEAVSVRRWCVCLGRICRRYAVGVLPVSACMHLARTRSGVELQKEAPSVLTVSAECLSCLLVFDTLFFFIHYSMHRNLWLYSRFHCSHHVNRDPFALAALDSTILELIVQQALAILSIVLVGCHPMSEILFHLLNIWLAVEDHCGYDFPWATHRLLPFFGGPPFHQAHHRHINGNYAPYFRHWDQIFGTALNTRVE